MKKRRPARNTHAAFAPVYLPWDGLGLRAWSLGVEASSVIALRMLRIAAGGVDGAKEARRMVSEKLERGASIPAKLLTARTARAAAAKAIDHYEPKVRANLKRLTKKK